jgi:rubrerythrin
MRANDLEPEEIAALREALDDEYKAWATYDQILRDFGPVRPFSNIIESEARHIKALARLFARYGMPLPPNPWPGKVERYADVREACEAAARGDIENERLYRRLLKAARRADVRTIFERLREASQLRHLPAFQRCLSRGGLWSADQDQ